LKKVCSIIFTLLASCFSLLAQDTTDVGIQLQLRYGGAPLQSGKEYHYRDTTVQINVFRTYISAIRLSNKGKVVWHEPDSYHLIDMADSSSCYFTLRVPSDVIYDTIIWNLGIDSMANVSGAMGGALDPTRGMYWSWQSGYINLKLEGTSTMCPARQHEFQFHLGGYMPPFASVQEVHMATRPGKVINVSADIAILLDVIDLSVQHSIMIPGDDAVALSRIAAGIFSVR